MTDDACSFSCSVDGDEAVLRAVGELDVFAAPTFESIAADLLAGAPRRMRLDLRDVRFIDSTGVRALVLLAERARRADIGLALDASAVVARLLELTGLQRVFAPGPDD